ncbi:MAG: N-6 DNA methylase [Tannerellaceae bacterium]|nr:N-6 DNA methylase [Tannerellaceae bacterium]
MTNADHSHTIEKVWDEVMMFKVLLTQSYLERKVQEIKEKVKTKPITAAVAKQSEKDFAKAFECFVYRYNYAETFNDFLDYSISWMNWRNPVRDFSYFEKKYENLYPKLHEMFDLLTKAATIHGGFHDALGDLFMELISHGRNGQFFTPESLTDMITQKICGNLKDDETLLDPACGSGRFLLSGAKINRKAWFFGCDNDITCCKMAVLNMLMNTMQGEIALMDSLRMEYYRSWRVGWQNIGGMNLPIFKEITHKDDSLLWQMHINTFQSNIEAREKKNQVSKAEEQKPLIVAKKKDLSNKNKKSGPEQLSIFDW